MQTPLNGCHHGNIFFLTRFIDEFEIALSGVQNGIRVRIIAIAARGFRHVISRDFGFIHAQRFYDTETAVMRQFGQNHIWEKMVNISQFPRNI